MVQFLPNVRKLTNLLLAITLLFLLFSCKDESGKRDRPPRYDNNGWGNHPIGR